MITYILIRRAIKSFVPLKVSINFELHWEFPRMLSPIDILSSYIYISLQAEILQPAIEGTLNVLRSCKKNPALRRVVLTSSSCTLVVRDEFDPKVPLDESTWSSLDRCEKLGERFQVLLLYHSFFFFSFAAIEVRCCLFTL